MLLFGQFPGFYFRGQDRFFLWTGGAGAGYYLYRVTFKDSVKIVHTFTLEVSWHVALFYPQFKIVTEQTAVVNPINVFKLGV